MAELSNNIDVVPEKVTSWECICLGAGVLAVVACLAWVMAFVGTANDPLSLFALWVPLVGAVLLVVCATNWVVLRVASPLTMARSARWHAVATGTLGGVWLIGLMLLVLLD